METLDSIISRCKSMNASIRTAIVPALLAMAAGLAAPAIAQDSNPPDAFDLSAVKFQIVNATFVTSLAGTSAQFKETNPDKYRGLVVTLKITKPPYSELSLICQDINLHYRYGENSDIARCFGLSTFSVQQDEDRAMSLYSQGWGKVTTGQGATRSDTVYVDLFFQNMEPETHDLHLFMAQPAGAVYTSHGWTKP